MEQFQLYKERDFSANFSDTIDFFKKFGKHYFKNYLIINGGFLLVLMVLFYFISKVYMQFIFSMSGNPTASNNFFLDYFNNNMFLIFGVFGAFILLSILLSILNLAYPVVYLQFIENNKTDFTVTEIIKVLKQNAAKLLKFSLGLVFIITPLLIILVTLNILLCFILIGIPILFIFFPAAMSWIALSFYEYITNDISFFESLKNGYQLIRIKFWPTVGTTLVMYMLVQTIQGIITMIPYGIAMASLLTSAEQTNRVNQMESMSYVVAIIMVISILLSFICNNFLLVNQGLIYYSLHENDESNAIKNDIDLIGTDSE